MQRRSRTWVIVASLVAAAAGALLVAVVAFRTGGMDSSASSLGAGAAESGSGGPDTDRRIGVSGAGSDVTVAPTGTRSSSDARASGPTSPAGPTTTVDEFPGGSLTTIRDSATTTRIWKKDGQEIGRVVSSNGGMTIFPTPENRDERDAVLGDLLSPDAVTRRTAVVRLTGWLVEHPDDDQVLTDLRRLLRNEQDHDVAVEVGDFLAAAPDESSFAAYIEALATHPQPDVRFAMLNCATRVFEAGFSEIVALYSGALPEPPEPKALVRSRRDRIAAGLRAIAGRGAPKLADKARLILTKFELPIEDGTTGTGTQGG